MALLWADAHAASQARRKVLREWRDHVVHVRPLRAICVRMRSLLLARAFDRYLTPGGLAALSQSGGGSL